ncbi:Triosephosphate isomerase [Candidatus Ecksteinia adelgidicola]|nr:Triosephosphate isomerase [Candidatus Ecksteinia adelgidicola]
MSYPLVIGNWKLNGNINMVNQLVTNLRNLLCDIKNCNVVIAPPVIYTDQVKKILIGSNISLGAQNVDNNLFGAFTGEISVSMLKDIGVRYVIIGHSERRIHHQETDTLIAQKFKKLKEFGLIPVLCIGETDLENKEGKTNAVCIRQIDAILNSVGVSAMKDTVIAYEPIWAIGTNNASNPLKVQMVHAFIRNYIATYDSVVSHNIIIQYGGSINETNAADFFSQPDIDGVLVGSSSLKADSFYEIVKIASIMKGNL